MSTDLREAFHRAANAVPAMGDAERAVGSGRRRRRAAALAAPLAVLAVVGGVWFVVADGVGRNQPPVTDTSPSPVTAADLAGRAFVTKEGQSEDSPLILVFDSTELTVTTPSSRSTVDYRIDEGTLTLELGTQACGGPGCGSPLLDLIYSQPTVTLAGAELTLGGAERTVTMTESDFAEADPTLTGRTWELQSLPEGGGSLAMPGGFPPSTLEFGDGVISVDYGCNTGGGPVLVTESTIEFGSISTTQIGCAPPVLDVEQFVQRVLWADGPLAYVIKGNILTITSDDGRLVYRAKS